LARTYIGMSRFTCGKIAHTIVSRDSVARRTLDKITSAFFLASLLLSKFIRN